MSKENKIINIKNFSDYLVNDNFSNNTPDLRRISFIGQHIKGMTRSYAGELLFTLAYMQNLEGDVVEIGSFLGKSTFFLGNAVKLSGNGKLFAIDHFKGNKNKENLYKVNNDDLSDLEGIFRGNITRSELDDYVILINKSSRNASKEIKDNSVRLIFIDGDHSGKGVLNDIIFYRKKLKKNATIIFDDYNPEVFPDLVDVVNEFVSKEKIRRKYIMHTTYVVELDF